MFTIANAGSMSPVGAMNDISAIPYIYEFTISLPGTLINIANAPIIGIVNTAMPEVDWMKIENTI